MATQNKKYAAYICYSHKDEEVASWLHKKLESYHLPSKIAPKFGKSTVFGRKLGKIFRDREELPAGQPLKPELYKALADSDSLIVLCSPNSAISPYVNDEIEEFRRLGREDRIIAVIIDGEPPLPYPPALKMAGENLNADFRKGKDGREQGAVKIIAGMVKVGADDLIRRERRGQRQRFARAYLMVAAFAAMTIWAMINNQINSEALNSYYVTNGAAALEHQTFKWTHILLR